MPKLYFYDVGLGSSLLEIETASQLDKHYLTGGLFENLVISEIKKAGLEELPYIYPSLNPVL